MKTNHTSSFTLIEVIVFVSVISMFFVTAAAVVTTMLRTSQINQNKIMATHYANELMEWLRGEKEGNWGGDIYSEPGIADTFTKHATYFIADGDIVTSTVGSYKLIELNSNRAYCFETSPINTWPSLGTISLCGSNLFNRYKRYVRFSSKQDNTTDIVNQVTVTITVEWYDAAVKNSHTLTSVFSLWEQ